MFFKLLLEQVKLEQKYLKSKNMKGITFESFNGKTVDIFYKIESESVEIISAFIGIKRYSGKQLTHKRQLILMRYAEKQGVNFLNPERDEL